MQSMVAVAEQQGRVFLVYCALHVVALLDVDGKAAFRLVMAPSGVNLIHKPLGTLLQSGQRAV